MLINKIIAKNFITPDTKELKFNKNGELLNAKVKKSKTDVVSQLLEIVNGAWYSYTISFEKFYPKFASLSKNMDLEIDCLISLDDIEIEQFNNQLKSDGLKPINSTEFMFQIKVYWPYVFPVVKLKPLTFKKEKTLVLGNHYAKFIKPNLTKKEILAGAGINAVAQFRKAYFNLKKEPVSSILKDQHLEYLKLIRATFIYDNKFIGKLARLVYNIDDGDILNYADNQDFYLENKNIKNWLNSFQLFVDYPEFKMNFFEMVYDYFLSDLQWLYSTRTINNGYEIQKLLLENNAAVAVDFPKYAKIFNGAISLKERKYREELIQKKLLIEAVDEVEFDQKSLQLLMNYKFLSHRQDRLIEKQSAFSPRGEGLHINNALANQQIKNDWFAKKNLSEKVGINFRVNETELLFDSKSKNKKKNNLPVIEEEKDFIFDSKFFD
ncbi:hypothetical protein [Spiroplasma alleghenense]|uniref:Uncharacterized protein n=1 Tax=Spiroplasma alleghenense TaxID=216931 RepID=A0A345Z3G7_9MOLU|nr:hypothetical protein [Spiroplasma alleghenense]AXK51146.1 hypothetical protein SALLE_v1c04720 [Spiroplasma alleghenense]